MAINDISDVMMSVVASSFFFFLRCFFLKKINNNKISSSQPTQSILFFFLFCCSSLVCLVWFKSNRFFPLIFTGSEVVATLDWTTINCCVFVPVYICTQGLWTVFVSVCQYTIKPSNKFPTNARPGRWGRGFRACHQCIESNSADEKLYGKARE